MPHRSADARRIGRTTKLRHTGHSATFASRRVGPGELTAASAADLPDGSIGRHLTTAVRPFETCEFVKYVGLTTSHGYRHAAGIADTAAAAGYDGVRTANDPAWGRIREGTSRFSGTTRSGNRSGPRDYTS